MTTTPHPLVSVMLITYAHERFIVQAVESVLRQQTAFPVEILISEDASPDRTRNIVEGLQTAYPGRIRLFLSARNQNDNQVLTRAWEAARGKYIAVLDGDDYWTDPRKLQKQVEFMEAHPEVFVCGHSVSVVDSEGRVVKERNGEERFISSEDLASGYCFPIGSVLFRNNRVIPAAELFNDVFNADNFMFAHFANFGSGYMSGEIMGAYRVHPGGAWSPIDQRTGIDHRNKTFSRIPHALRPELKPVGFAALLWHSLREDYRWRRKCRDIPYSFALLLASLNWSAFKYLSARAIERVSRWSRRHARSTGVNNASNR